jgi:divalent metal cation (Fe/Co/Zn/Cd) transporter
MATTPPLPTLPLASVGPRANRARLIRRARRLAWLGIAWHGIEAAVAIGAGVVASSVALVGFGADSLVEAVAGFVVLWRFAVSRSTSEQAERRAQQLIAVSFVGIALYVGMEAVRSLVAGSEPDSSWLGIGLSVVTLATMPALAIAKGRLGDELGSSATKSEGRQNLLCAYLSAALLVGLLANAVLGWWWADPVTALVIAAVAVKEGYEAWQGDSCCSAPVAPSDDGCCADACSAH